ncbi:receptor-type tyrosine-protein phosphatase H-like isoform X2 [Acipenser ruthenus]|uniref:receptor-type tyrosine-protein phosphatase H-like isoform X2 n=1 Tax=Acipenser ruthenus TaxID=7906 RepID=UPI0027416BD5|nr:receptor-type tyrosine-protein phosphatase H-like isoform X2 [Acipenser ruthenus]
MDCLLWLFLLFTQLHVSDQQTPPADNTTTHMTTTESTTTHTTTTESTTTHTTTTESTTTHTTTTTPVPTLPLPVSDLTVLPKSTTELHVNWTVPTGCNTGFIVSYNQTNAEPKNITENQTFAILTDLTPGTIYEVTVKTESNGKESSPVSSTGITFPSPVSDLTVLPNSTTELHVSWKLPSGCNTGFIVSYNQTNAEPKKISENQTFVILTDLTPGTVYEVTVKTESNGKESSPGSSTGITYPSPVSDITVTSKSTNEINYHWTVPNNTRVAQYYYNVTLMNAAPNSTQNNSYTANELQPGEEYTVCIESVTPENTSSTSTCLSNYTNPNAPLNLISSEGTTTAHVSWTAPSSDVNYRNYTYLLSWSSSNLLSGSKVINETSASLNALIPGSLYNVSVRSQIGDAQSVGESQPILTDPLPPTLLLVSAESETEAVLKWGDPASGGFSGFQIFYSDTNSSTTMNSVNQDVRQYKLTNLTPGEFYNISLRSFKTEASIRKNSTEEKRNFQTVPAQVSSLQCSAVSGGYSLSLDWGNPAGRWTEIEVDVSNGDIKKVEECGSVQCETRIDGLSPARYYTLAVTTVSGEKRSFKAISIQCQTDTTGVIVGSLFGILILICLVVFLVLFILRRYPVLLSSSSKDDDALEFACKKMKPIEVSKFADYFHRQQADSDIGFADEYQSLGAVGTEQTTKAALIPENRGKNRFTNVLPYDWCRVKLSAIDGEPFSDYINANYMPGYHTAREFIAAQGPLPNTVEDFWRMAWENQVEAIVMLTNCIENTRVKCEQYWPLDYTPCTYGDISVTTSSEQKQPDWTLRDFTLKHTKSLESRTVRQFHFTAWPDHGVPHNTATLIQFRALVRKFLDNRERNGPAIVHCSAGVGRTGTLIALDSLLLQIEREKAVGIQSFVQKMRLHRPLMVQTESQYIFLNQCMLDTIQRKNNSHPDENIYENMIYANAAAIREFHTTNGNAA